MSQVLINTPATLSVTFYDGETPTDPGVTTVTITRADGTAVATGAPTGGTAANPRTYSLAAQANLDRLTVLWEGASGRKRTTYVDIVGGFIVELADIRAESNLADTSKFPTAKLEKARDWFTDLTTDFCGFSPVPRFTEETVNGSGSTRLRLPLTYRNVRRLRYATIDGVAVDAGTLADWQIEDGFLDAGYAGTVLTSGRATITVGYEHGLDAPPADLERAALTAIRWRILTDKNAQMPDRIISMTNEIGGTVQFARANKRYPTGIDDVDSVLVRLRMVSVA